MAYQSRLFQSRWTYEPFDNTADDFNTRVGRVLNRGAYSSGPLHKSSTYASSIAVQNPKLADSQAILQGPQLSSTTSSKGITGSGSAYAWVDASGNQLQTTATHHVSGAVPSELGPASKVSTKPYNKEVVDLWKRVNPGVMERYIDMPESTMTDHFRWLPEQQEPLNMTAHFKKTDFSEYNEVAARSMKGLITNKSSA
ncbi:hypothetical protein WJX82_009721 [Trebouxia sp. C0006]